LAWRKKAITELEDVRAALQSKDQLAARKQDRDERVLRTMTEDLESQLSTLRKKLIQTEGRLAEEKIERVASEKRIDAVETRRRGQASTIAELESMVSSFKLQQGTLEDEMQRLRKQLSVTRTQNKMLQQSSTAFQDKQKRMESLRSPNYSRNDKHSKNGNNGNNGNNGKNGDAESPASSTASLSTPYSSPMVFPSSAAAALPSPKASTFNSSPRYTSTSPARNDSRTSTPTGPPKVKGTKASRARAARGKAVRKYQEMSPSEQSRNSAMLSEKMPSLSLADDDSSASNQETKIENTEDTTPTSSSSPPPSSGKSSLSHEVEVNAASSAAPTPVARRTRSSRAEQQPSTATSRFGWNGGSKTSGDETNTHKEPARRSTRIRHKEKVTSPSKIPKPKTKTGGRWR